MLDERQTKHTAIKSVKETASNARPTTTTSKRKASSSAAQTPRKKSMKTKSPGQTGSRKHAIDDIFANSNKVSSGCLLEVLRHVIRIDLRVMARMLLASRLETKFLHRRVRRGSICLCLTGRSAHMAAYHLIIKIPRQNAENR